MKMKRMLSVALSLISYSATAQTTLTAITNSPVAGDNFTRYSVGISGVNKGGAGDSVIWNFKSIEFIDSIVDNYLDCAATPYCDSFSGANLVVHYGDNFEYLTSSTLSIEGIGAFSDGHFVHFSNQGTVIKYPLTYGSTFTDDFAGHILDSTFSSFLWGTNTFTCDAWGTLITPYDTFKNVLRLKSVNIGKDSLNFIAPPKVNLIQKETYRWFIRGFHSPILTIEYILNSVGVFTINHVYYNKTKFPNSVVSLNNTSTTLTAYPNPAADNVTFGFDIAGTPAATNLVVYDATGRVVNTINGANLKAGKNEVSLNASNLPAGMYIVRLQGEGAAASARFSVVK